MEIDEYVEILKQSLSKEELAGQLLSRIFSYDRIVLNKRIKEILEYTKSNLDSNLEVALTDRAKNNYEKIGVIAESTKREVILNYNISIMEELLKESKKNG